MCAIAAFSDGPLGLSVVLSSEHSSLSLDMPNLDEKHAHEIQIVLVVADKRAAAGGKGMSSTTYEIDTRPDSALKPYQKAERANKGITGKVNTTLMSQGNNVMLSFSGETASGPRPIDATGFWVRWMPSRFAMFQTLSGPTSSVSCA